MLTVERGEFRRRFPSWALGVDEEQVPFAANIRDNDLKVGPQYFDEHFGDRHQPAASKSLIPAFDEIDDELFAPRKVHPLIRDFYRNSGAFNMVLERVTWMRPFACGAALYTRIASRVFKQMAVPASTGVPRPMQSIFGQLDVDGDGTPDFRTWVRFFPAEAGSRSAIFYVAALHTIRVMEQGCRRSFLSVCLPLFRGNKTSVFAFENLRGGGLTLTTRTARSNIAGGYLVFHDTPCRGKVSYLPALGLGETLRFWVHQEPGGACIRGEHLEFWRNRTVFRLEYRIARGEGRQIRLERANDAISSVA